MRIASVGVSPPIFLSFFPFVIAGLDPAIHAKASLAQRFHRRFVRDALSMVVTSFEGGVA